MIKKPRFAGLIVAMLSLMLPLGVVAHGGTQSAPTSGTLVVINNVFNIKGGTATPANFSVSVSGLAPTPSAFFGSATGTSVMLGAGSYGVASAGPNGYISTYSADCSGSIALGQVKTCTVSSYDIFPLVPPVGVASTTLEVIKLVNGGSAAPRDFTMHVTVTGGIHGAVTYNFAGNRLGVPVYFDYGTGNHIVYSYNVSESGGPGGYTASYYHSCQGQLAHGQAAGCTIVNTFTGSN